MSRHLDDERISAMLIGVADEAAQEHLAGCLGCRRQVESFAGLVGERRRRLLDEAPRWDEQRRQILDRVAGGEVVPLKRRPLRVLAVAAAAAVIALGLALVQLGGGRTDRTELPVEQILAEVDATLASDSLPGFERLEVMVPDADELEGYLDNPAS
jgi:hypothetical protein